MVNTNHLDELGQINLATETYVISDKQVLVFKRSDSASKFPGFWTVPGGHIDSKEDALSSAVREIKEETGVEVGLEEIKLKAVTLNNHIDRGEVWVSFVYLATIQKHQVAKKYDIEGKAKWISIRKFLTMDNVFPPLKVYLDHVLKDKPGIMYTNTVMKNSQPVKIQSKTVDRNG